MYHNVHCSTVYNSQDMEEREKQIHIYMESKTKKNVSEEPRGRT